MNILLAGASGRFGSAFRHICPYPVHALRRQTRDVQEQVDALRPDWVVNAAAMSDVDGCEKDPAAAVRANALFALAVAAAAQRNGARLLHLSTDYVFDGKTGNYAETAAPSPLSVYGVSKWHGERLVQAVCPEATIARSSVLFGAPKREDFVTWLIGRVESGHQFSVVDGQRCSPTSVADLAHQCLALIAHGVRGLVHTAGADALTRFEMAQIVADAMGKPCLAKAIPMGQVGWNARRPVDSSLDVSRVRSWATPRRFAAEVSRMLEVR